MRGIKLSGCGSWRRTFPARVTVGAASNAPTKRMWERATLRAAHRRCMATLELRLLFVEEGIDVGGQVGAGPILGTDDFAVEAAAAGDDVSVGIHGRAVGEGNLF